MTTLTGARAGEGVQKNDSFIQTNKKKKVNEKYSTATTIMLVCLDILQTKKCANENVEFRMPTERRLAPLSSVERTLFLFESGL